MPPAIQTAPAAPKNAAPAPVAVAPSTAQVFENKIAGQLQYSNQIDSRQPSLSTTVPKYGLIQWNHIRKHRGAHPPIFEKITHFELTPRGNQTQRLPTPNRPQPQPSSQTQSSLLRGPGSQLQAPGPRLSIRKQNRWTTSTLESNRYPSTSPADNRQQSGLNPLESNSYTLRSPTAHFAKIKRFRSAFRWLFARISRPAIPSPQPRAETRYPPSLEQTVEARTGMRKDELL